MIWSRLSATGNSFFFSEQITNNKRFSSTEKRKIAKDLCNQFANAKTDGLLFLEPHREADFSWDFYNADGSSAEMCGNAARCAALFYQKKIKAKNKTKFVSPAGQIETEILENSKVKVLMPRIIQENSQKNGIFAINTGVPHVIVLGPANIKQAKELREQPSPAGSNVTFLEGNRAITYERGVENFTSACGTGAVAAAAYLHLNTGMTQFQIEMPGGVLEVEIANLNERPFLTGPARWDFELEIFEDKK